MKVLLYIPQLPFDPSSGAARSMRGIAELLAASGFSVRCLAPTAVEAGIRATADEWLTQQALTFTRTRDQLNLTWRSVSYCLLDTGRAGPFEWEHVNGDRLTSILKDEIREFRPDILFTYGGSPADQARYRCARQFGVKVVFGLRNAAYSSAEFFETFDGILTPSKYLSGFYAEKLGLASSPIPPPIDQADTIAANRDPIFFATVNPTRQKGALLTARLAEELGRRRPDIPFLIVESRGCAGALTRLGLDAGFDLRRHGNIMSSPAVPFPRDIYGPVKALLVPSLNEAFGRVAAEALMNGIPPITSGRGGLPEAANGAGFTLPLPADIDGARTPVTAADVKPWLDLIERLEDDSDFYQAACQRASTAAEAFSPASLGPRYSAWFRSFANKGVTELSTTRPKLQTKDLQFK